MSKDEQSELTKDWVVAWLMLTMVCATFSFTGIVISHWLWEMTK